MRESREERRGRVLRIIRGLKRAIPDAKCSLDYGNPLELLIATILSAQCTDERVNAVTPHLFGKYRTAEDYATAELKRIEEVVRSTGFFRNKAKNIKSCCQNLVLEHGGEVPKDLDAMTRLPGVGRKTANVVMGNAFRIASGVVVDTHVRRITNRLGLTRNQNPEKIEQDLIKLVPKRHWVVFPHLLIHHGRRTCTARAPECPVCAIKRHCPSNGKVQTVKRET